MADSMEKRQRERKKREKKQQKAERRQEKNLAPGAPPIADEDAPSRFDLLPEYSSADELTEVEGRYRTGIAVEPPLDRNP
jgi:hypothetical protein